MEEVEVREEEKEEEENVLYKIRGVLQMSVWLRKLCVILKFQALFSKSLSKTLWRLRSFPSPAQKAVSLWVLPTTHTHLTGVRFPLHQRIIAESPMSRGRKAL